MYARNDKNKDYVKLIIRLPKKIKYDFKMYCLKNNRSMNSVINELIESILKKRKIENIKNLIFYSYLYIYFFKKNIILSLS